MPYAATIRTATLGDAAAMSALVGSLMAFLLPAPEDPEAAAPFLDEFTPKAFRAYLSSDRYRYHVAEREGALVGMVGIRDNEHLFHLMVAERAHRQGLARRLWTRAKRETIAAGNPGYFTVNSSPYAVPVYRRFGFVATAPEQRKKGVVFVPMELDER
jgi:GNAT superfamily N-acetyltransferase